ncbi:unnamed protein product [Paramecium pentaurelia]|uniref:G domain-containing protein n=1 Tax=Paramecium pentaurelia TaxID=43138 RepID=A0A8S1Y7A8_9CILI|nr:unnamed protein product [Paramecium pentaurelia]
MGQSQDIVQGSEKSQQFSVLVLCLLKQNQQDTLGFNYSLLNKKLNIFPSFIINPFRIFVNDLDVFQTSQEFSEFVQCVNLESYLKRIVIFIDVSFLEQFNRKYCKIIQSEIYNQISEIFIFDVKINAASQQDYSYIYKYYKNISIFTNKQQCFQKILENCQGQLFNSKVQLNHKSTKVDEGIIQNITNIIEGKIKRLNNHQSESENQFDNFFKEITDQRNTIIQSQATSALQNGRNQLISDRKFNYKIMEQISRYTNCILEQIIVQMTKFQKDFYFCQTCKLYFHKSDFKYNACIFFNGCFKNQSCQNCNYIQASFDNLKILYESQKTCFQIEHCLQYLNQNQMVQSVNDYSQSNLVNNYNHHIILIGKTGVGKTRIFNFLCDGKAALNIQTTQEPMVKKCLNSNLTIMDTPPFELEKNDLIEDGEKIKQKFSNILKQQQVSQIFIIVKYERLPAMKQNMVACLKFLGSFRDKISIIINNNTDHPIIECQNDLKKKFETNRILIFCMKFAQGNLKDDIEEHLQNLKAKLEYLKIDNTDFDINKCKNEQDAMIKKLEKINNQKKEFDDIQQLIKENQHISDQIQHLNQQQQALVEKFNKNSKKVQDYFINMGQQQFNNSSISKSY